MIIKEIERRLPLIKRINADRREGWVYCPRERDGKKEESLNNKTQIFTDWTNGRGFRNSFYSF